VVARAEPLSESPAAPKTLGKYGRECWLRLAPLLVELRMLTRLHLESLELMCDWWDVYQVHKLHLQKHPDAEFFTTDSGYEQRSPRATARDGAYTNFVKLATQFGLTPQSSGRIAKGRPSRAKPTGDDPSDEIGKFAASKYGED
jgi:P27 family predicted phage terminase small subunit